MHMAKNWCHKLLSWCHENFFPCSCFSHPVLCLSLFCNLLAFAKILLFFNLSSKFKCLICKGQCSPFSADMCCARAVCAKKQCSEFVLVIYKNKMCSNLQWGLAWALKASLKASVLAASIIVSGSSSVL